jgi:hypothetical protein
MSRSARLAARPPASSGIVTVTIWALAAVAAVGLAYVIYLLWPRWPDAAASIDVPSLPIIIGETYFNVPPRAIRQKVQRHAGAQERIDLAYAWPTLEPAAVIARSDSGLPALPSGRLFVTIAVAPATALTPEERMKTVYPRYTETVALKGPDGLSMLPFRPDTPYQGEDLLFDPQAPDHFLVRCTRDRMPVPGMCIYERFFGKADVSIRVPRAWLGEWRNVLAGIERLVVQLQPAVR